MELHLLNWLLLMKKPSLIQKMKFSFSSQPIWSKCTRLVKILSNQLRVAINRRVHSELSNIVLASIDDLTPYIKGRDLFLVFNSDIGSALATACDIYYDDQAVVLAKAGIIVQRYMLNANKQEFDEKIG